MERYTNQRQPQQLAGLSFLVLLHVLVVYAFLTGLASNRTDSAPTPLLVRLIALDKQEAKLPPPVQPRLKGVPQAALLQPPSVDWTPPEELPRGPSLIIEQPPRGSSPIADNGHSAGTDQVSAKSIGGSAQSNCSNVAMLASTLEYPARARRLGLQHGQASVEFTVTPGGGLEIQAVRASSPAFEGAAMDAVRTLHCSSGHYLLPISFVLQQ